MHSFTADCGAALDTIMGIDDARRQSIAAFEQKCLDNADPMIFLEAIMTAECPQNQTGGH